MNLDEFLGTIYLHDRWCQAMLLETRRKRVAFQVDCISRIRSPSGWEYYTDEDIKDGWLVFTDVESVECQISGPLPGSDWLEVCSIRPVAHPRKGLYEVKVSLGSAVGQEARRLQEVESHVTLVAAAAHLEDPARPGEVILD